MLQSVILQVTCIRGEGCLIKALGSLDSAQEVDQNLSSHQSAPCGPSWS